MALTECKECKGMLSTKATFCPHCGCPTTKTPVTQKQKYHRLPNGFGSIRKYGGKRRNPYYAYPSIQTVGYYDNGTAKPVKCIGSYHTYQEAYQALTEYNKKPYDLEQKDITFAEVYQLFFDDKFVNNTKKKYSNSSINVSNAGYKNLKALHNKPIKSIRTYDMQKIIDSCTLSHASLEGMLLVLHSVFKFAVSNDITDKDYSQYVVIKTPNDDEKGVPFTEDEIKILWEHCDDKIVQYILILIYSGMRVSELATMKIDFDNDIMQGGVKTYAGKDRIIPIHPFIKDYLKTCDVQKLCGAAVRNNFYKTLDKLGILTSSKNTKHTPHDCRHTFSWLADKYKLDDLSKKMIIGHAFGTDVDKTVYGHRTVEELKAEMNKIKRY